MQRNTMQIENDLINDFYKNTREEIKDLNAQVRNYDAVMQREEESAQTRILSHQQKVEHINYEHEVNIAGIKGAAAANMEEQYDLHAANERGNLK